MDRLENIVHLAQDFEGVDPLENPMPVKPGQHYNMGGIETNEHGKTCIDGLYAAGESACVSLHGANRLGGNALPDLFVFGARAGRHAAGEDLGEAKIQVGPEEGAEAEDRAWPVELGDVESGGTDLVEDGASMAPGEMVDKAAEEEREFVEAVLSRESGVEHMDVRKGVQETMTAHVNVFREEGGLEAALEDIAAARKRYEDVSVTDTSRTFNTELQHTIETRNVIDLAETVVMGALARTESRGAHWRRAHQERKDDEWLVHTMVTWNEGDPEMWYRPGLLAGDTVSYEPSERSY